MSIDNIIKFKKICDLLNINTNAKEDFSKRLVLQKLFYLLQKLGLNLEIKYNFYKYGPYSSDLTDIYYTIMNLSQKDFNYFPEVSFSEEELNIIHKLNTIYQEWGNNIDKLEFYTSVLYIYTDMYLKNQNKDCIKKIVNKYKPRLFIKYNFDEVLEDLKIQGFLKLP
ncbi:MAG: hypothetical protein JXA99_07400 [Candidatus Lokiarchaeota archaeon]|nr:hypothetical protein [Candidatus Lokiarchaeota archaeon]